MANVHEWYKDQSTGQYVHDISVTVDAPVEVCFQYWANLESFPSIMTYVTEVTRTDGNTWHWAANIGGYQAEWDAVTTVFRPGEEIAWESTRGLRNTGSVLFTPMGLGCQVTVHLMYDPPFGFVGDLIAERRLNDEFHRDLRQDLMNFKNTVERGQAEQYRRAA